MRILQGLIFLLAAMPLMAGTAYKWTDADGRVHYGDDPSKGKAVNMPGLSTYSPPPVPKRAPVINYPDAQKIEYPTTKLLAYTSMAITSPQNDETIISNQGLVDVIINVKPELQPGHAIKVYIDGVAYGKPQTSRAFRLKGIERGTHQLRAVLIDDKLGVKKQTKTVSFHLRQHSIARPQPR